MDRSWKTKLLRRLAPVVASAALASYCTTGETPIDVSVAAGQHRTRPIDMAEPEYYCPRVRRLPQVDFYDAVTSASPDAATVAEPTSQLPRIEPLEVPTIDLSAALAAIVQPPTTHSVNSSAPRAALAPPPSRWSDQLYAAHANGVVKPTTVRTPSLFASHIPLPVRLPKAVELERLPRVVEQVVEQDPPQSRPTVPARLASAQTARLGAPQLTTPPAARPAIAATTPAAPTPRTPPAKPSAAPRPVPLEVPLPSGEDLAMRAVHVRAEAMIHHAFGLARRGAHYSAKAELVEVLRTTTQALDMRDGTTAHSDALARAFRALDEASDFQPRGAGLESNLDMAMLIAGHRTPVLKEVDLTKITPLAALQNYYTYAQQQFIIAGGEQPVASASLYGLGRLQALMSGTGSGGLSQGAPQAMVFHQAAVLTDGNNYKSANELGVLLARYGQYDAAREMLIHTVRVRPNSQSWQNLASVHERLGEMDLARRAMHEAKLIASGQSTTTDVESPVRWIPAETLARSAPQSDDQLISPVSNRTTPAAEPQSREVRGIMKFLPWSRAAQ